MAGTEDGQLPGAEEFLRPVLNQTGSPFEFRSAFRFPSARAAAKGYNKVSEHARQGLRARHSLNGWLSWGEASQPSPHALLDGLTRTFAGVLFVGDSQVREIAWAAAQWIGNRTGRGLTIVPGPYRCARAAGELCPLRLLRPLTAWRRQQVATQACRRVAG